MENPETKEEKEDNSYTKGVNEEEKGDTLMKFKNGKKIDKNNEEEYNNNNIDPNNPDIHQNYNESNLKTENKIKLNPNILKQSKLNSDNNSGEINKKLDDYKNDEAIESHPTFRGFGANTFTKINRCFSDKSIMIITIIMLIYSILLLAFSILDFIKIMKLKTNNIYFMNTNLFLILDVINISSILIYHMMNYFLKPNLTHNIILLLIILLVAISIIRCLNYAKKREKMFAFIINLCQNVFAILINGLTLYFFLIDAKKRKNDMHGIEEIINFTELNANVKNKKEEGLSLEIASSNKMKSRGLVEEEADNNKYNNAGIN